MVATRERIDILAELRLALGRILDRSGPEARRLSRCRTSVRFATTGCTDGVTLLLDRPIPRMLDGDPKAEIEIEIDPADAAALATGHLAMPAALTTGRATATGPVRRYLEVEPILRDLLAGQAAPGAVPVERATWAASALEHRPELLAIETRDLHKGFGGHSVLAGANVQIPEGTVSVVLGPSGTGKSVLLKHVIGLLRPDAGDVVIRGRSLGTMSRSGVLRLRREIGVMFQDGALFSTMNVFDNVAFPLRQHTDFGEKQIAEIAMGHLTDVGLGDAADRSPAELSGGMRKRAGLARALALDPGIVLCDEPDSGLDPVRTSLLGDLLVAQHAQHGGTMVIITHNIALARQVADHVTVLWEGKVLEAGLTEALLASDSDFVRQFLSGDAQGPLGMD
ncbi:MAG: ABC transporter ATP-binding protein [Solirubrobacteraceae bacterium]